MLKNIYRILSLLKTNFLKNKEENTFIFYLGIVFFLINVIKAFFVYWPQHPIYILELLWFCNVASFLICFYIFFAKIENLKKMASILLVMAIPMQAPWIIGFILGYFDIYNLGRLTYMNNLLTFEGYYYKFVYFLSFFEHAFLIPFLIFIIYKLGFDKKIYKTMILIFIFISLISFFVVPDNINLHCMKYSCDIIKSYDSIIYTWDYIYFIKQIIFWFVALTISFFGIDFLTKKLKKQENKLNKK